MSLLSKTSLEEYARQCTLQRRHYEDRLQTQQRDLPKEAAQPETIAQSAKEKAPVEASQSVRRKEQNTQSCVADLLEISTEPLSWDDKNTVLHKARNAAEEHQWQRDRPQKLQPKVTNPTGNLSPVSYGAP